VRRRAALRLQRRFRARRYARRLKKVQAVLPVI